MTEVTQSPNPPGDPEWKDLEGEFLDRRDFEILRDTFGHYAGASLSLVAGWGDQAITHHDYPQDQDFQETAQNVKESIPAVKATKEALQTINYDSKIVKFGGQFIFDIDADIQSRLNPTAKKEEPTQATQQFDGREVPNRFEVYKNTISHHMGNILSDLRGDFEHLEEKVRDLPDVHFPVQKTYEGILKAAATKHIIDNLSPNTDTDTDKNATWYKLDDQINAKFRELQQTYLKYRKP